MFETISEKLGIEHVIDVPSSVVPVQETSAPIMAESDYQKAEEDFEFARKSIKDAIESATSALDDLSDIARESEHPRAYEVLATLTTNVASMADTLVKIHKETLKTKQSDKSNTITNNTLVMSTDEVIKLIRQGTN